jgi:hypothetical protein
VEAKPCSSLPRSALDSDNNDNINDRRSAPKQRVSQACDRCRSRRAKCDGSQPTCVPCAAANVTCTYSTHTKKRGLPTGYVRMLKLLWVLVFDTIPGAEDATLQLLRSASVVAGDAGVALLYNAKDPMRDRDELLTQDFWARSKVREALDARVLKIDAAGGRGLVVAKARAGTEWFGRAFRYRQTVGSSHGQHCYVLHRTPSQPRVLGVV